MSDSSNDPNDVSNITEVRLNLKNETVRRLIVSLSQRNTQIDEDIRAELYNEIVRATGAGT